MPNSQVRRYRQTDFLSGWCFIPAVEFPTENSTVTACLGHRLPWSPPQWSPLQWSPRQRESRCASRHSQRKSNTAKVQHSKTQSPPKAAFVKPIAHPERDSRTSQRVVFSVRSRLLRRGRAQRLRGRLKRDRLSRGGALWGWYQPANQWACQLHATGIKSCRACRSDPRILPDFGTVFNWELENSGFRASALSGSQERARPRKRPKGTGKLR